MTDSASPSRSVIVTVIVSAIAIDLAQFGLLLLNSSSMPGLGFPWRSLAELLGSVCLGALLLLTRIGWLRWAAGGYYCVDAVISWMTAYVLARVFFEMGPVTVASPAGIALGFLGVAGAVQLLCGIAMLLHPGARAYFEHATSRA